MLPNPDLTLLSKLLPRDQRRKALTSLKEVELHKYLKKLFDNMEPNYTVEITHGTNEYGKDLVIFSTDKFSYNATAVVVKMGDIIGRTAGDVDEIKNNVESVFSKGEVKTLKEIESQIQQAKSNPADLKTVYDRLPISKVFIILCGSVSGNAKNRLRNELQGNLEVFDIEWLIDNFTHYYPEIFFEGEVIDFVLKLTSQLEQNHWLSGNGKNLSDYYVDPYIYPMDSNVQLQNKTVSIKKRKKYLKLDEFSKLTIKGNYVIFGDPGTGKSALLNKMAIDRLRNVHKILIERSKTTQKISIPMIIKAVDLVDINNLDELNLHFFSSTEIVDRFKPEILLIDGLDEVRFEETVGVLNKITRFSKELKCNAVVTSRRMDIVDSNLIAYDSYEIKNLEYGQAVKLFRKLISSSDLVESLKSALDQIKNELLMVPLSLMLIIELVEKEKEIPSSVTELYNRYLELALGKWDSEKGIRILFDYVIKERFLAELAHEEFFLKHRLNCEKNELKEFKANYAKKYGMKEEEIIHFAKEIERSGILDVNSTVIFKHRSFLDYFSARYIDENREDIDSLNDKIVEIYFSGLWRDVCLFYVGLRTEIRLELLKKIFAYNDPHSVNLNFDKFMVGRLLQFGWHSTKDNKNFGLRSALKYSITIRKELDEIVSDINPKFPKILLDFIILALAEQSFGSSFLHNDIEGIMDEMFESEDPDNLFSLVCMMWAIRRFFAPTRLGKEIDRCLEFMSVKDIAYEDQARTLVVLAFVEKMELPTSKAIKRKLDKFAETNQPVLKRLLPSRK